MNLFLVVYGLFLSSILFLMDAHAYEYNFPYYDSGVMIFYPSYNSRVLQHWY